MARKPNKGKANIKTGGSDGKPDKKMGVRAFFNPAVPLNVPSIK